MQNHPSGRHAERHHPSCTHLFYTVIDKEVSSSEPLADCFSSTRNLFQMRDRKKEEFVSALKGWGRSLLVKVMLQQRPNLTAGFPHLRLHAPAPPSPAQSRCHLVVSPKMFEFIIHPSQPKFRAPQPFLLLYPPFHAFFPVVFLTFPPPPHRMATRLNSRLLCPLHKLFVPLKLHCATNAAFHLLGHQRVHPPLVIVAHFCTRSQKNPRTSAARIKP